MPKGNQVVTDMHELAPHNEDWTRKFKGHSELMLKPTTTEQVSQILKHCNARRLAVVPQSGNTGLVGGNIPVNDEIIINMSLMDKIIGFDH